MKIGLFDVDSVIPNLALMKISAYHKSIGDETELYQPIFDSDYDHIYASKVFTFPHENDHYIKRNDPRWSIGGSGINLKDNHLIRSCYFVRRIKFFEFELKLNRLCESSLPHISLKTLKYKTN